MAEKRASDKGVGKEAPQPRDANDSRQQEVTPNPDRDTQGDAAEIRTVHTPGS